MWLSFVKYKGEVKATVNCSLQMTFKCSSAINAAPYLRDEIYTQLNEVNGSFAASSH